MDWLKAIISFLLAIIIVGVGSVLINTVSSNITDNSDIAGMYEPNVNTFFANLAQYTLTIFSICVLAPLIYIIAGGSIRRQDDYGGRYYER